MLGFCRRFCNTFLRDIHNDWSRYIQLYLFCVVIEFLIVRFDDCILKYMHVVKNPAGISSASGKKAVYISYEEHASSIVMLVQYVVLLWRSKV